MNNSKLIDTGHTRRITTARRLLSMFASLIAVLISAPPLLACSGEDIQAVGSESYFPLAYGDYPTNE